MEVRQRLTTTLTAIMEKDDHHHVLVVSHGGAIRQFIAQWQADPCEIEKTRVYNGCIATFDYDDHHFHLLDLYNPEITESSLDQTMIDPH